MANFRDSTQYREWMFDPMTLHRMRQDVHEKAYKRFGVTPRESPMQVRRDAESAKSPPSAKRKVEDMESESPMSISTISPVVSTAKKARKDMTPLTVEEQETLIRHWAIMIRTLCEDERNNFGDAITASAITFMKRFFLHTSVVDCRPQNLINAAVLVAIKVEACPYTEVDEFTSRLAAYRGVERSEVVEQEMLFMLGIKYHLTLFHPFISLKGFIDDFYGAGADTKGDKSAEVLRTKALELARWSLTTDCCFLFTPGQIALACLRLTASDVESPESSVAQRLPEALSKRLHKYVDHILATKSGPDVVAVTSAVDAAAAEIRDACRAVDLKDVAKGLDKRLKRTTNPKLIPGTTEYDAELAEKMRMRAEYKADKLAVKRGGVSGGGGGGGSGSGDVIEGESAMAM